MKNLQNEKTMNPCSKCSIAFMAIFEDCTFCSNFEKACAYHGTNVEEQVFGIKTSK